MSVGYPIFVFEKDDHSMCLIENEDRILYHLEAIDIENDEYVFWEANGGGVRVDVSVGAFSAKLISVTPCSAPFPLQDAFKSFNATLGLPESLTGGTPMEVWQQIQEEVGKRPRKKGIVSRIRSRL